MEFLEWKKDYELGLEQIDLQHKNLVAILNQLYDFTSRDTSIPKQEIQEVLISLTNYVVYHFDTEEDLMERYKYPASVGHRNQHESFKNTVTDFLEKYDRNELNPIEIAEFLKHWLLNHIAKEDTALVPYLKSKGVM